MSSKNNFYFTLQGHHKEVTGSCIVCTIHFPNNQERKFLVDFGLFQELEYEEANREMPVNISEIDAVLITHSHVDHVGRIPFLVKNGYNKPIYSTFLTKVVSEKLLYNSAKVFQSNYDKEKKFVRHPDLPLYHEEDVEKALSLMQTCKYNVPIQIDDNITVTFLDNGHILSASCILVEATYKSKSPLRILFTGDYKGHNTFKEVIPIPKEIKELPLNIVTESTLCEEEYVSYDEIFKNTVISCIERNKGMVILSLAQERYEEILYNLKQLQEQGYKMDICTDAPLAKEINSIYSRYSQIKYMPEDVINISSSEEREIILNSPQKRILIVSSGMGDFGNAPTYLNNFLQRTDYEILFTSFLSEHTLGKRVLQTSPGNVIRISGFSENIKKVAKVNQTREFTSHATLDELADFLLQFKKLKNVIINHGNENAQENLRKVLDEKCIQTTVLGTNKVHMIDTHGNLTTQELNVQDKEKNVSKPSKKNLTNRTIPLSMRSSCNSNIISH